jgi:hypothetical protein
MLVSVWMKFNRNFVHWSLTSQEVKGKRHWEKSQVASFYGTIKTSCFQGHHLLRLAIHHRQGHRLLWLAIHHLQVNPSLRGTAIRVHLDLRCLSKLCRPLSPTGKSGRVPPPLRRWVLSLRRKVQQRRKPSRLHASYLTTWMMRIPARGWLRM